MSNQLVYIGDKNEHVAALDLYGSAFGLSVLNVSKQELDLVNCRIQ